MIYSRADQPAALRSVGKLGTLTALAASLAVSGCASSITSAPFDPQSSRDGIVYKLPVRQYTVAVTYQLTACAPLQVEVADVAVSSALVPTPDMSDWFEIDPRALNRLFSSVDPATLELNNGMLSSVGLKTTGAPAQVLALGKELTDFVALSGQTSPYCTEPAKKALETLGKLTETAKVRKEASHAAEEAASLDPSIGSLRRVQLERERLAQATAALVKHRDGTLRKTLEYRLTPCFDKEAKKACESGATTSAHPNPAELADWVLVDARSTGELRVAMRTAFHVKLALWDVTPGSADQGRPAPAEAFPGIYYRRPGTAMIVLTVASGNESRVYRVLQSGQAIPQAGSLQRIAMKGSALGARNVSVAFDENGDLKKYELTSKGMAEAMTASLKEVSATLAGEPAKSELDQLTEEVNLLKKRRELIDAQAALESAQRIDQ